MGVGVGDVLWLVIVGALWGCTNPYLKRGAEGVNEDDKKEKGNVIKQFFSLFSRWRYLLPFAMNKLGSVIFFWRLSGSDMSLVNPIANGLSFLFTAFTGALVFHERITPRAALGAAFVATGIAFCTIAKK